MAHYIRIEVLQEDGRTLEVTPGESGVRTSAPLVPRGELLEFGGMEYVIVAVRQQLRGHLTADEWDAVTTYLVDEAVEEAESAFSGPLTPVVILDEVNRFLARGGRGPDDLDETA